MILILILYFCLACGFAFGKAALTYMPPMLFIGIRMTLAGLLLGGYQRLVHQRSFIIQPDQRLLFAGMCLFHIYGSYVLEYWAMQYTSSFKASLLYNLSPFVTALLASVLIREVITRRQMLGLVVGSLSLVPILVESEPSGSDGIGGSFLSWPELALFGSVTCAALGWILMRKLVQEHNCSPVMVNSVSMIVGGFMALVTSFMTERHAYSLINLDGLSIVFFYIFLLIFLCNIVSYNLYGMLLRSYSATFLSFAGFVTPLFTAFLSSVIFRQTPTISFFVSVFGVGVGLYLFYGEELRLKNFE